MHARRVGDLTCHRVLLQVDHHNFRRVRQVKSLRRRIHGQNIPAAFTADRDFVQEFVSIARRHILQRQRAAHHQRRHS